jgi:hypothetical protein
LSTPDRSLPATYMAHLDGPQPSDGLALAASDVQFQICVPGTVFGGDREALASYIKARDVTGKQRVHVIQRQARDGDVEFVLGEVRERGQLIGTFLGAMRRTDEGTFDRYVSYFQTDLTVVDEQPEGVSQ